MSDREDFRRHSRQCRRGWPPPGVRRLDLFPDFSAFPVWEGGGTSPTALGISSELAGDLQAWQDVWEAADRLPVEQREVGYGTDWGRQGRVLAKRLEAETGAVVVYDFPTGR